MCATLIGISTRCRNLWPGPESVSNPTIMKSPDLNGWIQRYFQEYLVQQRNVSPATVAAYRDTFRLLLRYLRQKRRRNPDTLSVEILTPETVLAFLHHLEQTRGNVIRTRNARLAALRSFVHYLVDWLGPELPAGTRRILAIPFKRQVKRLSVSSRSRRSKPCWRRPMILGLVVGTICSFSCSIIPAPAFPSYSRYGSRMWWAPRPSRSNFRAKAESTERFRCGAKPSACCAGGFERIDFRHPRLCFPTATENR